MAHVYVLANGPRLNGVDYTGPVTGTVNISALNGELTLVNYAGATSRNQDDVTYAGAVQSLSMSSGAAGTPGEITVPGIGGEVAPEYSASVTIRPIMSRIEVEKVSVLSEGTVYFDADFNVVESANAAAYKADYTGFQPEFVGLYMSDCYTNAHLFPYQTSLTADWNLFTTPTFHTQQAAPIQGGLWFGTSLDTDVLGLLCQANYNASDYEAFSTYTATAGTAAGTTVLFDGVSGASPLGVPAFEFYVPFDITSDADATSQAALSNAVFPGLHFQFRKGADLALTVNSGSAGTFTTPVATTDAAYLSIANRLSWPSIVGSENGIAFANVAAFYTDQDFTTDATLHPGCVYRIKDVVVGPANINANTAPADAFSVYVYVSVIPFTTQDIYPSFD